MCIRDRYDSIAWFWSSILVQSASVHYYYNISRYKNEGENGCGLIFVVPLLMQTRACALQFVSLNKFSPRLNFLTLPSTNSLTYSISKSWNELLRGDWERGGKERQWQIGKKETATIICALTKSTTKINNKNGCEIYIYSQLEQRSVSFCKKQEQRIMHIVQLKLHTFA